MNLEVDREFSYESACRSETGVIESGFREARRGWITIGGIFIAFLLILAFFTEMVPPDSESPWNIPWSGFLLRASLSVPAGYAIAWLLFAALASVAKRLSPD